MINSIWYETLNAFIIYVSFVWSYIILSSKFWSILKIVTRPNRKPIGILNNLINLWMIKIEVWEILNENSLFKVKFLIVPSLF